MNSENFAEQLLRLLGIVSAIAVALSQYVFRDSFSFLFEKHPNSLFHLVSTVSLILAFTVILGVYAYRYNLTIPNYLSKKQKARYFSSNSHRDGENVPEPWSYTIRQIATALLILPVVSIFVMLRYPDSAAMVSISYIAFITTVVFSLSVFSISVYLEHDYSNRQKNKEIMILKKIEEALHERVSLISRTTTRSGIVEVAEIMVGYQGNRYKVICDINNPNNFFSITPVIQHQQDSRS